MIKKRRSLKGPPMGVPSDQRFGVVLWLKFDFNTICCGERTGKIAMSLIRQRFVPDLIEMLMRSREALVNMNPASETGGNVAFGVRRRSFRLRATASIPGSFPSCFSSMFALGNER
ncbi:hypothetical protein [Rhizobium gallicum]|uniref:hypothetical protein n=1 Tax=Rhizobium gallicum TaxID=56730 RepID=UPI0012EBAA27|nr:hypothetical protein [Rhizobium gallicum]